MCKHQPMFKKLLVWIRELIDTFSSKLTPLKDKVSKSIPSFCGIQLFHQLSRVKRKNNSPSSSNNTLLRTLLEMDILKLSGSVRQESVPTSTRMEPKQQEWQLWFWDKSIQCLILHKQKSMIYFTVWNSLLRGISLHPYLHWASRSKLMMMQILRFYHYPTRLPSISKSDMFDSIYLLIKIMNL